MDTVKLGKFKNYPTQKFYEYFYPKFEENNIDTTQFIANFCPQYSEKYRNAFFHELKEGHRGITVEQLEIAYKNYGISPNYFFGEPENIVPDAD